MKSIELQNIKKYQINNLIEWLICFAIFCSHYVEIIILCICCLLKLRSLHKLNVKKRILIIISVIALYSTVTISLTSYSYSKFLQQLLLLSFYLISYSILLSPNKNNIISLFNKYLKLAYYIAYLGLVQWIIFILFHINIFELLYHRPLYAVNGIIVRITSIIDEPGYLSIVLTPAITYYMKYDLWPLNRNKLILFIVYISTLSAVSYVVALLVLISKIKKKLIIILCCSIPIITIGVFNGIGNNDDSNIFNGITERIEDSINGIKYFEPVYFEQLNLSSYTLVSNLWVATHAPNRIVGTGLGTHEQNYFTIYKSNFQYYGFNSKDGYSLFNRVFSEFGLVGIIVLILFILKYYNNRSVINICAFFLLLSFIIKGGHYVRYGLIFWSYIYYFTRQGHITIEEVKNEYSH